MNRHIINGNFDGRRFLVQVLLGVAVVIWGAGIARAQETPKPPETKQAEYFSDTFKFGFKDIRLERFDPMEKRPAVLLLHGADGGVGVEKLYRGLAQRMADKGYVVFIVHYLDSTKPEPPEKISPLVKEVLRGKATKEKEKCAQRYFDTWTRCVTDAVGHIRRQPGVDCERVGIVGLSLGGFVGMSCAAQEDLKVKAVVCGFGSVRKDQRDAVKCLPPTLAVGGEKDEVVPVAEVNALKDLADSRKLPITVKIYPTGHVFEIAKGKYDWWSMVDAERRTMEHLETHLLAPKGRAQGK
jgi:dienelactone hydrolase